MFGMTNNPYVHCFVHKSLLEEHDWADQTVRLGLNLYRDGMADEFSKAKEHLHDPAINHLIQKDKENGYCFQVT